jgi:hypothetical protein
VIETAMAIKRSPALDRIDVKILDRRSRAGIIDRRAAVA